MNVFEFYEFIKDISPQVGIDEVLGCRSISEFNAYPPPESFRILLIIEMKEWPADWRPQCGQKINVRFWYGENLNLKHPSEPQHNTADRDNMQNFCNDFVRLLYQHNKIHMLDVSPYKYFSAAEGVTLENYSWVMFDATMKVYDE